MQILDLYRQHGKSVLLVDYIWDTSGTDQAGNTFRFNEFYSRAYAQGFIPYAADSGRALDEILFVSQEEGLLFAQPRREKKAKKIHPRRFP